MLAQHRMRTQTRHANRRQLPLFSAPHPLLFGDGLALCQIALATWRRSDIWLGGALWHCFRRRQWVLRPRTSGPRVTVHLDDALCGSDDDPPPCAPCVPAQVKSPAASVKARAWTRCAHLCVFGAAETSADYYVDPILIARLWQLHLRPPKSHSRASASFSH